MKKILLIILLNSCLLSFGQDKNSKIFETICDSIYKVKKYKIIQTFIPESVDSTDNKNTVFQFILTEHNKQTIIYQDTIYSNNGEIEFKDFNNDGTKDILIQHISDVRSNQHYYLYLVDTKHDKLTKIKGFEEIKNPNYLPKYNLIDNYVMSGKTWTSFYKIENDSIKDFNVVIYDDNTGSGKYEREYKKSLKSILKRKKPAANRGLAQ